MVAVVEETEEVMVPVGEIWVTVETQEEVVVQVVVELLVVLLVEQQFLIAT